MARTARLEFESGAVVCDRCLVADTVLLRLRGLIGRPPLEPDEGLLLRPCGSIHTFFMGYPLDIVFCDRDLQVLAVAENVPRRRTRGRRGARVTIELAAGAAARRGVVPGVRLRLVDA